MVGCTSLGIVIKRIPIYISSFLAVFSAIFQSSTFGFAGVFPAQYTSSVLSGQVCVCVHVQYSVGSCLYALHSGNGWYICSGCIDHI